MSSMQGESLRARIIELEKVLEEKEENVVEYLARIEQLEDYIGELQNRIGDKQESIIKPTFEEDLSEKERILNLLKSEALSSKEIAKRQNLTEQDTRTYLLRLKKEDRIRIIEKIGRYNIYAYKAPTYSEDSHSYSNALEYDLSYLINLMEMKMTLKQGIEFSQSDLLTIKRIKQRINQKKEDLIKGIGEKKFEKVPLRQDNQLYDISDLIIEKPQKIPLDQTKTEKFKDVLIVCPVCNDQKILKVPLKIVEKSEDVVTINIPTGSICEHHFQVFIDRNFTVRGYQKM